MKRPDIVPGRREWLRLSPAVRDTPLAVAVAVIPTLLVLDDTRGHFAPWSTLWLLLVLASCGPLAQRRLWPLSAAATSAAASLGAILISGYNLTLLITMLAIASASYHSDRHRVALGAGSVVWTVAYMLLGTRHPDIAPAVAAAVMGIAPVTLGYALRLQVERGAHLARLERAKTETARQQERARIAHDVHDVVGHHLSAIRLQAVGGRKALAGDVAGADRALCTIAELSHHALEDIRGLLDQLRTDAVPDLTELPDLVERLSGNGLRIDLTTSPDLPIDIVPDVQACAYRVVQESLTNVARHSLAERAGVRLERTDGDIVITVDDPGPARDTPDEQRDGGLHGMRERLHDLHGSLQAAPHGRSGWRVRATLPLDGAR